MLLLEVEHVLFEDLVGAVDHEGRQVGQSLIEKDAGVWVFENVEDFLGELLLLDSLVDDRSNLFADLGRAWKH